MVSRASRMLALKASAAKVALLVHGAGGGAWEYDLWHSTFAQHNWRPVARNLDPVSNGDLASTTLSDYELQVRRWAADEASSGTARLSLVGASMGGAVVLRAAPTISPAAIVLINPVVPQPWAQQPSQSSKPVPDVLRWAGSSLERTAAALHDSTPEIQRWACERWRDESGAVMRELYSGYTVDRPRCPVLFVVSLSDRDVPPEQQLEWAAAWGAETLTYSSMSHVGPLLGTLAPEVASAVAQWLERTTAGAADGADEVSKWDGR